MKNASKKEVKGEVLPAHSKIGASSMHRWGVCPGSVALCANIPNTTSEYAAEGHQAHELAAYRLENGVYDRHPLASNEEMLANVEIYVQHVEGLIRANKGAKSLVEHKFDLSELYPGLFGTADSVVYAPKTKTLHVSDLKYGAGVPVSPEENEQLMYYGLGALLSLNLPCEKVVLHIVQPRCEIDGLAIRSWETDSMRLLEFSSELIEAAERTTNEHASFVPGEDQCRFCPGKAICPALQKKAQQIAKNDFTPISPECYDPLLVSQTLEWLPMLESYIKGVRELAYNELSRGKKIPGWKLVAKRATKKWNDEAEASTFIQKTFREQHQFFETSLKSPAKIEKLLPKENFQKLNAFVCSVSSGNTLAQESDPRAEVKILDAKSEFDAVTDDSIYNQ